MPFALMPIWGTDALLGAPCVHLRHLDSGSGAR